MYELSSTSFVIMDPRTIVIGSHTQSSITSRIPSHTCIATITLTSILAMGSKVAISAISMVAISRIIVVAVVAVVVVAIIVTIIYFL